MLTSEEALKAAKEELYTAIQALEDGDLPYARSSSLRAAGLVVEAHQSARKASTEKLREATQGIVEFTEMFRPIPDNSVLRPLLGIVATSNDELIDTFKPFDRINILTLNEK